MLQVYSCITLIAGSVFLSGAHGNCNHSGAEEKESSSFNFLFHVVSLNAKKEGAV